MKTYLLAHWQGIATFLLILVIGSMYGCAFMKSRPAVARLAVTIAVGKYIDAAERPAERAQRVRNVANKVLALADAAQAVTVDSLKAAAIAALPASLTPTDRVLATAIIDVVVEELKARVSDGQLPADQLVNVRSVIQWVLEATAAYLPAPATP